MKKKYFEPYLNVINNYQEVLVVASPEESVDEFFGEYTGTYPWI